MCDPIGIECYEQRASAHEGSCWKECDGIYSVVQVDTNNRTLTLNGKVSNQEFQTFFEEYLQFKRAYEPEFDNIYKHIVPSDYEKYWPFLNEQVVLVPKVFDEFGRATE